MEFDLDQIDRLTPYYRHKLENELSVQERKVIVAIAQNAMTGEILARRVAEVTRIVQLNQVHTILGRLTRKGFLRKVKMSTYAIIDQDLVAHLLVRSCGVCHDGVLLQAYGTVKN